MAILFLDSFDLYSATADGINIGKWDSYTQVPTWSTTTRYGVGRSFASDGFFQKPHLVKTLGVNTTNTVYLNFATATDGSLGGTAYLMYNIQLIDGATNQLFIGFYRDGTIKVYRGSEAGTLLATFTSAHAAGTVWAHWQIKIVFNSSTGSISIRKDGATSDTFSATGLNTMNSANAYINKIDLNTVASSSGGICYIDDFVLNDSSGSVNNSWLGDIRIHTRYPTSPGSSAMFTNNSTSNWFANSEALNDGDTTYTSSATINDLDLFTMGDIGYTPLAIYGVQLTVVCKKTDSGTRGMTYALKSGSTTSVGSDTVLGTTYTGMKHFFETDPDTSALWTPSAVDNVEAGYKLTS